MGKKIKQSAPIQQKEKLVSRLDIASMTTVEITKLIEEQAQLVILNPEENIKHLQVIQGLLENENAFVVQIAALTVTEVFVDTAPMQKIDENAHEQALAQMVKKDERQIIQFELKFAELYKRFVNDLCCFVRIRQHTEITKAVSKSAIICLCRLMERLYQFNNSRQIIQHVTFALLNENTEIQNLAYESICRMLRQKTHSLRNIKVQMIDDLKVFVLTFISKMIQSKQEYELPDWLISCVNEVEIDTKFLLKDIENDEKTTKQDLKRKKREFFSDKDKQKKNNKQLKNKLEYSKKLVQEVKKDQQEAQVDLNKKQIAKQNAEILEKEFYLYFKILKTQKLSKFYISSLDGILKFVHLINVDLIWSLIQNLIESCTRLKTFQNKLNFPQVTEYRLQTVFTLQAILNGPGQVFEIDDKQTVKAFFQILLDINKKQMLGLEQERLIIELLQICFMSKRQLSQEVVGSFIKAILNFPLTNEHFSYAIAFMAKSLFQKYSKTSKMVEDDNEGFGLHQYNNKVDDPSSTNAINSSVHNELQAIKQKWSQSQRMMTLIQKILKNDALPQYLVAKKPLEVYDNY